MSSRFIMNSELLYHYNLAMKKLKTYTWYFVEYLKHGDIRSIIASVKYLINKKSHKEDRIITSSIGKFFCRKNTNDFQFANYHYEWGVKKYFLGKLGTFDVFIDGGACVGDYCVLLSQHHVRCIAFEPVIENFNVITKNLELNNLTGKVLAFPYGLGMKNATAGFVFNPINTGASHMAETGQEKDFQVELKTFDSLLPLLNLRNEDRILFKLDVEGMEPEAILGAREFISSYQNITFVIEDKHTGEDSIRKALDGIAAFDYGIVDEYNIFAIKVNSQSS